MHPAYIQTSTNNSVNRIISKEEERRYPRRGTSIFIPARIQECFQKFYTKSNIPTRTTVFPHAIQQLQVILHTELVLLQEISKKYYSYKAHPVQINTRDLPATVPVSPSILHGRIRLLAPLQAFQGPTAQAGFQQFYLAETAFQAAASTHAAPVAVSRQTSQESTWYYRILPGEIGFTSKGLSIVCPCNTKFSVFQITY